MLDLVGQEVQEVAGDGAGVVVERFERGVPVGRVGGDDGHHLLRVHQHGLAANAVAWGCDGQGYPVRGQRADGVVDVVHAVEVFRLPRVDLDDHLVSLVDVGAVHAHRR